MKLTNEEIQAILDGAPEGATHCFHYGDYFKHGDPFALVWDGKYSWFPSAMCGGDITHNLTDLREILELRQEVERLRSDLKISMSVVDSVVQSAIECSDICADELQSWLVDEGVLKVVPFDPTKHYDYEHETQEGQDWITWSDWYEKTKE